MDLSQVEVYNKEVAEQRAQRDKDYAEYEAAGRIWGLVPVSASPRSSSPV